MSNLKLGVEVLGAQNLVFKDGMGSSSSFVELHFDGHKFSTSTKEKDLNPVWNERFFFDVPNPSVLPHLSLEAFVYGVSGAGSPSSTRSLLGKVCLAGTSFGPSSAAAALQYPLEKRSIFSRGKSELNLKVYLTEDYPSPPVHVFRAQQTPPTSPTMKKSPEKKTKPRHIFHHLPRQKHQTYEPSPQNETRVFAAIPSSSSPEKPPAASGSKAGTSFTRRPGRRGRPGGAYDLVQLMEYLFVRVVKARDLAAMEIAGSVDPYVELKLGNYTGQTRTFERNENPEWDEVFAFAGDQLQSSELEVEVKNMSLIKDDFIGIVRIDLRGVPQRTPPDSPLAPEWYRLENKAGQKLMSELMLAVWFGSQADEMYPEAILSETATAASAARDDPHLRAKVYHAPRLWYVQLKIIEAQDIVPGDKTQPPELRVRAKIGMQEERTSYVQATNLGAKWNKDFMFVVAEPFEEDLFVAVEEKAEGNKSEETGAVILKLAALEKRWDERPVPSRWLVVEKSDPIDVDQMKRHKFSPRLNLIAYLDGGYHVFDEPTQFCSDLRPTAKELAKNPIGVLELGILLADGLSPVKNHDGTGSADVYCVAKYGGKWVRTRTVVGNLQPKFNEQYTWEVFDPATVLTIAVFHSNHGGAADRPMGKARIRLSNLETGRIYNRPFPLLVPESSGVEENGSLHLTVRFSAIGMTNVMWRSIDPVYPKQHYKRPIPTPQLERLRQRAMEIVTARLGRAEPPLKKSVVEYVNDPGSNLWSMRKGRVNVYRLLALISGPSAAWQWFNEVCKWKSTSMTTLVHLLFIMLVVFPELILPTAFLYMFLVGLWNYFHRQSEPPAIDMKLSHAERTNPDELDEELDRIPTSRSPDLIRVRYDRLRQLAGWGQTLAGDIATQGERLQGLLNWRDPRATFIFWVFCLFFAVVVYVIPFKLFVLLGGLFAMRHPKLRSKSPSWPSNFFRRLPTKIDQLL